MISFKFWDSSNSITFWSKFNIASILIICWCDLESVICLDSVSFELYITVSEDRFEIFLMRKNLLDEISEADEKLCSFDDKTDVLSRPRY